VRRRSCVLSLYANDIVFQSRLVRLVCQYVSLQRVSLSAKDRFLLVRPLANRHNNVSLSETLSFSAPIYRSRRRLQNAVLVVGPGTPAAAIPSTASSDDVSSSEMEEEEGEEEVVENASSSDDDDQDEEQEDDVATMVVVRDEGDEGEDDEGEQDDVAMTAVQEDEEEDEAVPPERRRGQRQERQRQEAPAGISGGGVGGGGGRNSDGGSDGDGGDGDGDGRPLLRRYLRERRRRRRLRRGRRRRGGRTVTVPAANSAQETGTTASSSTATGTATATATGADDVVVAEMSPPPPTPPPPTLPEEAAKEAKGGDGEDPEEVAAVDEGRGIGEEKHRGDEDDGDEPMVVPRQQHPQSQQQQGACDVGRQGREEDDDVEMQEGEQQEETKDDEPEQAGGDGGSGGGGQGNASNDDRNDEDAEDDSPSARALRQRAFERAVLRLVAGRRGRYVLGGGGNSDDDDDDNDDTADAEPGAAFVRALRVGGIRGFSDVEDNDDDDDDGDSENDEIPSPRRFLSGRGRSDARRGGDRGSRRRHAAHGNRSSLLKPSLRHGGCINTACWLDRGWSLSAAVGSAGSAASLSVSDNSNGGFAQYPTQIVTSGDDRQVKFWDVSGAMGTDGLLPGGWNTFCPFADNCRTKNAAPDMPKVIEKWKSESSRRQQRQGSVLNLVSVATGHRGNVFHVAPCVDAGKVLTCGADGYLRVVDAVAERSSVVVHPYVADGDGMADLPFVFHSGMAYSHHLVTPNTGLLCSERGLHHFDLRLAPREQARSSLLRASNSPADDDFRTSAACKACAIWSPHSNSAWAEMGGSNYVFAGGASANVCLYDLRMDGSRKRVVERYKPRGLDGGGVSVSGLDVSKDGKELLVSYESDQIYSFPICHQSKYSRPTLDDIDVASEIFEKDEDAALPELASYGGHLNRFTFLKNARYAGPADEYICTGSDSGHAWIYERSTGTVVSLLGADSSTCNGVVPHPSLPFFITYGIDSSAKLWRGTGCVDPYADDSPEGRARCSLRRPYEMSPVAKTWDGVQTMLKHMDDEPAAMPDYIASSTEVAASGRFTSPCRRGIMIGTESPSMGNSLLNLPSILRQNRYECYYASHEELDVPVSHPLVDFTVRLSQARLRYQADMLGLRWDPWTPWALLPGRGGIDVHPADLVPDFPSDWINFDPKMRSDNVLCPRSQFCIDEPYGKALIESYFPGFYDSEVQPEQCHPWHMGAAKDSKKSVEDGSELSVHEEPSFRYLYDTALLLKEAGNQAVNENLFDTAARRYDKAIQYCAVAFMRYFDGDQSLKALTSGHHETVADGKRKSTSVIVEWSPLLRILITSRLNMALLLLKPSYSQPDRSAGQARAALKLLAPFTVREGKAISVRDKKEYILKEHEPVDTYKDAQALQAKAYYRLGSAELASGDYAAAIKNFEESLKSTSSNPSAKPDSLTERRLEEAKRKYKTKKKRDRARFQKMHCDLESDRTNGGEEKRRTNNNSNS